MRQKLAVVGASGLVGRALLDKAALAGVETVGLSRRAPDLPDVSHVSLDLTDGDQCRAVAQAELRDVTHLVYAALYEQPGLLAGWLEDEQMQTNLRMLDNLMTPLVASARSLRGVTLLQGTKAYGAHIRPMKIPGREHEPRVQHPNFYWLQEDYLGELRQRQDWSLTIWRPQVIIGHALGAPMNMLAAIGAYGALCRHSGEPMSWPGGTSGVQEAIDADLLAEAILFSLDKPAFADETFNITNGDVYRFESLWPALADAMDLSPGSPVPRSLSATCYDERAWTEIVASHGLRPQSLRELIGDSFFYADALFNHGNETPPPPALLSTIKLRQAGFTGCVDTEDMFVAWLRRLREMKILP